MTSPLKEFGKIILQKGLQQYRWLHLDLLKSDDGWRRISKQKFSSVQEVIYLCKTTQNNTGKKICKM
jgi:hypothetical protein